MRLNAELDRIINFGSRTDDDEKRQNDASGWGENTPIGVAGAVLTGAAIARSQRVKRIAAKVKAMAARAPKL
jgi:hypothetical protein